MPTFRVDVDPDILIWARMRVGLSTADAAQEIGVSETTLRLWEVGADEITQPTLVQLRKMAKVYIVPLPILYMESPPQTVVPKVVDLRIHRDGKLPRWSLEMHAAFSKALKQREVAMTLGESNGENFDPKYEVLESDPPESIADGLRTWLGIQIQDQLLWQNEYVALHAWSDAIEAKGILVTHTSGVNKSEMRGFSISEEPFPVIVLNGSDRVRARIFTLIHELSHVLMKTNGLCNLMEPKSTRTGVGRIETFCNQIAGATLLPLSQMKEIAIDIGASANTIWTDQQLSTYANKYKVSREVFLRRAVTMGAAPMSDYFLKLRRYNEIYEEEDERLRREKDKRKEAGLPTGGGDSTRTRLRNLGRRYTKEVLVAYRSRQIDAAELSQFLDTKTEMIPKLAALIGDSER